MFNDEFSALKIYWCNCPKGSRLKVMFLLIKLLKISKTFKLVIQNRNRKNMR